MSAGFSLRVTTNDIDDGAILTLLVRDDHTNQTLYVVNETVFGSTRTFIVDKTETDTWPASISYFVSHADGRSAEASTVRFGTGDSWTRLIDVPEDDIPVQAISDVTLEGYLSLPNQRAAALIAPAVAGSVDMAVQGIETERTLSFLLSSNQGDTESTHPSNGVATVHDMPQPLVQAEFAQKLGVGPGWSPGNTASGVAFQTGFFGLGVAGGSAPLSGSVITDGFSLRPGWRVLSSGQAIWALHMVYADQANDDGDYIDILRGGATAVVIPDTVTDFSVRVILNTGPAIADGELHVYTDGVLSYSKTGFRYMSVGTPHVDQLMLNVRYGGENEGGSIYSPQTSPNEFRLSDLRWRANFT